jgi:predicted NAD/FAD-dependent oxidoreductase
MSVLGCRFFAIAAYIFSVKKLGPVAIIGAGLSGLSCAQALRAAGVDLRVFESSSVVGGRCATRLWQGHLVDLGVQYFTAQSTEFKKELLNRLRQFRPLISPILDREETVVTSEAGPRFYVLQGNNYFAHVLSHGLDLRLNTPVESLSFSSSGIECLGETYPAVVSSLPGPLSSRLLGLARSPAEYEPCLVALLEYAGVGIGNSRQCFARLLPEGSAPLRSSYCENNKVGRIVGDKSVFVAQASPRFSREHATTPPEDYLPLLARANEKLWEIPDGALTASFGHRWIYARPLEVRPRSIDLPPGAFICGDSHTDSTVESVWLDGRKTANDVLTYLASI